MIIYNKVILREKRPDDAWDDYAWETDPELSRLDAAPVLSIPYPQYLEDYTNEIYSYFKSGERFAIDTLDGRHIGNCSYYNFDEFRGNTELGIMIGDRDYWSSGYGTEAVTALVNYIFNQTKLKRIYLKTLDWNSRAKKCFTKCGFRQYGEVSRDGYNFLLMEIHRDRWEKQKSGKRETL